MTSWTLVKYLGIILAGDVRFVASRLDAAICIRLPCYYEHRNSAGKPYIYLLFILSFPCSLSFGFPFLFFLFLHKRSKNNRYYSKIKSLPVFLLIMMKIIITYILHNVETLLASQLCIRSLF